MELFDKKFVHFLYDDELERKEGFFADDINALRERVNENITNFYSKVCKAESTRYPFAVADMINVAYRFFYYDLNYAVKKAFAEGKQIQCRSNSAYKWLNDANPTWEDVFEYRIKPEEEIKTRRMTYRQLAEWLAKGNGEYILSHEPIYFTLSYDESETNAEVSDSYKIRRWSSGEWIEPTVDVYEEDCMPAEVKDIPDQDGC